MIKSKWKVQKCLVSKAILTSRKLNLCLLYGSSSKFWVVIFKAKVLHIFMVQLPCNLFNMFRYGQNLISDKIWGPENQRWPDPWSPSWPSRPTRGWTSRPFWTPNFFWNWFLDLYGDVNEVMRWLDHEKLKKYTSKDGHLKFTTKTI